MTPYTDINELIANFEAEMKSLSEKIKTLQQEPQSFNEQVIFKYIDTASTGKTKDFPLTLSFISSIFSKTSSTISAGQSLSTNVPLIMSSENPFFR